MAQDELIEEIQQDIRHEALLRIWKQYGKIISFGVLSILACVTLFTMWGNYKHKRDQQIALEFQTAHMMASSGKTTEAIDLFEKIIKEPHPTYSLFAKLYKAKLTYDPTLSADQYASVIKDHNVDEQWRDLAYLFQTYIVLDTNPNEEELKTRLEGIDAILKKLYCPWKLMLMEMKGLILFSLNRFMEAAEVFSSISKDPSSPKGLLMRSNMMSKLSLSKSHEK